MIAGREERRCTFVPVRSLGQQLANGTYTGAKKLIYEKAIDMYSRPESIVLSDEEIRRPFFEISPTCASEQLHFGQFLNEPLSFNMHSLQFLAHSLLLIKFILIGFFNCFIFYFLLSIQRQSTKVKPRK